LKRVIEAPEADKRYKPKLRKEAARVLRQMSGVEASIRRVMDEYFGKIGLGVAPVRQSLSPPKDSAASAAGDAVPHGELRQCTMSQFQTAARRVHFSVIERRTEDFARYGVIALSNMMARGTARMLGDSESMALLLDENQADVAALEFNKVDLARIRDESRLILRQSYDLGNSMAMNELNTIDGTKAAVRRIAAASLRDKAAGFFDAKSMRMAEDMTDQARKIIQTEIQNGVKFGKPISEVRASIWNSLVSKGLTTREAAYGVETDEAVESALNVLWAETEDAAAAYLNTVVRTNTFEAFNEARYEAFTDSDMAGFVVALEYAAVLDGSTTDICEELDGNIYSADSPVWDRYRPPNHFNCRSVLMAITAVDGWDGQESEEPSVEPQGGFK
jgi:SPP1 gp7 family putative phage head morphogenesis protein